MKNQRQKHDYKAMDAMEEKIIRKETSKDYDKWTWAKDETIAKVWNNRHCYERRFAKQKADLHKRMDTTKKQDLLNKIAEQYKTMDTTKRQWWCTNWAWKSSKTGSNNNCTAHCIWNSNSYAKRATKKN